MSVPWLAHAASHRPDHPALLFEGRTISYAELQTRVDGIATRLAAAGVGPGARLALLAGNSPEWVGYAHACQALGAALVALNTRLTPAELVPQLTATRPALLVCDDDHREQAEAAASPASVPFVVLSSDESRRPSQAPSPVHPVDLEADLALLFTSGTTASPKAVRLPARCFAESASLSAERLGSRPSDVWLACLPLFHVGGLSILMRCAIFATTVLLHRRFEAKAVAHDLREQSVTAVSLVPTTLERVLDDLPDRPPDLRFILLGGGPTPRALLQRALRAGLPLATTYGLSEACSQVATSLPGDHRPGAPPLPKTEIEIRDDRGRPLVDGEPGEVCVRGPQLMAGYLDAPETNAETLRHGWLHTGDVGRLDADGRLHILDRRRDLIVSGGENVYPAEVEALLRQHPSVADAAVIGETDATWGQRVIALIVSAGGGPPDAAELEHHLRQRLAGYKIPREFHPSGALPRTASGKLRRHLLTKE